jgi:hypothetical protein
LTVLIAALLPLPAVSQTVAAGQLPRVGERIRVTTTTLRDLDGRRVDSTRISVLVGTVVAVRPDGLVVADSTGRELMVPTQNATRFQVYGGTTVSPVPPLLGVLAGAALGGLIGAVAGTQDSTYVSVKQVCVDPYLDFVFGCSGYTSVTRTRRVTYGSAPAAALGAAIGGVLGGVIGLISAISDKRERWTEIPIGALQVDVGSIWTGEVTARLTFRLL